MAWCMTSSTILALGDPGAIKQEKKNRKRKRKEKIMPFGVNLMRSQVLFMYRAAQAHQAMLIMH